jgi:type II secretory pathway component PulC
MAHLSRVAFAILYSTLAHAAPTPTAAITVELDEESAPPVLTTLVAVTEEPGGLAVPIAGTADFARYGLQPGDVIRGVNGSLVFDTVRVSEGVTVLDVVRQHKPLLIKVVLHGKSTSTTSLTNLEYLALIDRLASPPFSSPVLRDGKASGVRITSAPFTWSLGLADGDIVRAIDGHSVTSDAELLSAVRNLRVGVTRVVAEHEGRPLAIEITRDKPIELGSIRALGANRVELGRELLKQLSAELGMFERHVEAFPVHVTKESSVSAVRLVVVQPDSLVAALGLQADDLLIDLNGFPLETVEHGSKAMDALLAEATLTLHLERKGKRIAITYQVR